MLENAVFVGLGFFLLASGLLASIMLMIISRNKRLDGFMLLSASDIIATLASGLLLLIMHFKIELPDSKSIECSNENLAMHLSIFILPMITTLGSMPFWFLQMYQYAKTQCIPRHVHNETGRKSALTVIAIQWLVPLFLVSSIFKTEPEVMKMENSEWQENSIISIRMGEVYCWDLDHENDKIPRSVKIKQLGKLQNISAWTSNIVERVHNIVEQESNNNNSMNNRSVNGSDTSTNDLNVYINSFNTILGTGTNKTVLNHGRKNISNKHNSTVYHANNIGNMLTRTLGRLPATRDESTSSAASLDKIIANFLAGMYESHTYNENPSTNLFKNKQDLIEMIENYQHDNSTIYATTKCTNVCLPSRAFLKHLFFGLLFLSLFIPINASILLQSKTTSSIKKSEFGNENNDRGVQHLKKVIDFLVKTTFASGMMVSPSLIESSVRSLISNEIPQCISKFLFIMAQVGMIIRNVAGVQMVKMTCNKRLGSRDTAKVHPQGPVPPHEIEEQPETSSSKSTPKTKD